MRHLTLLTWIAGGLLLAWLLASSDPGAVLQAVAAVQAAGLAAVILFHLVPMAIDVAGWQLLFVGRAPAFGRLLLIRWVGEGVNTLLPIPNLGELVRARLTRDAGIDGLSAGASVLVDVTLGVATQVSFILLGLACLGMGQDWLRYAAALLVLSASAGGLFVLQRSGAATRLALAIARRTGAGGRFDASDAARLDAMLRTLYARRRPLLLAFAWRFAGWIAGAGEVWLALRLLGHPVGIAEAIALESLSQGARAAAFLVPGGLGIQDGSLMLLCLQLGIGAEAGLALSLIKRVREVALGLPALAVGWLLARPARALVRPATVPLPPARAGGRAGEPPAA